MNTIEEMLTGQIEMPDFIAKLKSDPDLQSAIRNLVPTEAVHCENHPLWKWLSFEAVQDSIYDVLHLLCKTCKFDGTMGDNLNYVLNL